MNSVLIIDKPAGMTSHDVVNRVRRILGERSVGHLGTLDPAATGVLPLITGKLTRLAQFYTGSEKSYDGTIRFGFATDTYDADGEPTTPITHPQVSLEGLLALAGRFRGVIHQAPPPFSAKKIGGVPAYKLARKHKEVTLEPAEVEIKEFEILSVSDDRATFRARVSSGTYMRSIAHDLGQLLGCGAHLEALRRTSVAEFDLSCAHTLEELAAGNHEEMLVHPRQVLPAFPCVTANDETAARIRTGQTVNLPEFSKAPRVKVFRGQADLIAIVTRVAGTLFHPGIVLVGDAARETAKLAH